MQQILTLYLKTIIQSSTFINLNNGLSDVHVPVDLVFGYVCFHIGGIKYRTTYSFAQFKGT